MIGRRSILAGGLAALAAPAFGQTRPKARPDRTQGPDLSDIIAAAKLGGEIGYIVADAATGAVLAARGADTPMPPASVTKALTALFVRNAYGAGHRLTTQVIAAGPIQNGTLQGDLILSGGGDPSLDTDRLGDLAAALAQTGIRRIRGQFLIWNGALPLINRIDAGQPDHVGYNATISGIMLNFNRAQFVWARQNGQMVLGMNAEGARFNPAVRAIRVRMAQRESPLFTYETPAPLEEWSVAAPALNKAGSRWLPVRAPLAYVGDVFSVLCAAHGIDLPSAQPAQTLPAGQVLAQSQSEPLDDLLRGMLRYSTNITAEALGLAASRADSLPASARVMSDYAASAFGTTARFVDHSGLGAGSSCTPRDMLRIMLGARGSLPPLLRARVIDTVGREDKNGGIQILAKSGTLNFTSNLAGYVQTGGQRQLAFAIFAADSPRRAALPLDQREDPPGGAAWNKRARAMQRQMIAAWSASWL